MTTLLSIFVPDDRVRITEGPMHGFDATVLAISAPGKLVLAVDGFDTGHPVIVRDESVDLCKPDDNPRCEA